MKPYSSVIFLPVTDIQKTVTFYHDVLGLKIDSVQADNLYIFDTGYGYWGFCMYPDHRRPLSGPDGVCLSINLENDHAVLAMYDKLKDICPVYKTPAKHPEFPVYSFFIQDPNGYLVEFQNVQE